MTFNAHVCEAATNAVNAEHFALPTQNGSNIYSQLKNQLLMTHDKRIVKFGSLKTTLTNHFTLTLGFMDCRVYCPTMGAALKKMDAYDPSSPWQHVIINMNPEQDGSDQPHRNFYRQKLINRGIQNPIILYPVDSNGKPSNTAAIAIAEALNMGANPNDSKKHDPNTLTFTPSGIRTGEYEASQLEEKYNKPKGRTR